MSSAIAVAEQWTDERVAFILKNFCGDAPQNIAQTFVQVARSRNLSPEAKQIYLIKRGGNWTMQTSIDGYRAIAARTGDYAGSDDAVFEYDDPPAKVNNKVRPSKATVTVWKFVHGVRCPFSASARWDEYAQQNLWLSMPHVMLAKVAESLALRKAFPDQLSGIYTDDEMSQADAPRHSVQNAAPATTRHNAPQRTKPAPPPPDIIDAQFSNVDAETGEIIPNNNIEDDFLKDVETLENSASIDELKGNFDGIWKFYRGDPELQARAKAVYDRRKAELAV